MLPRTLAKPELPVRNINTGIEYATIQAAINAKETLNNHIIHVNAGTYYENIVINKSITLIGQNKLNTTIIGPTPGNIIYIKANNTQITGFTIKESTEGYSGIYIYNSIGCNITDNIIENNYYGVHMYNSANITIYNNFIMNCEYGTRLYNSINNDISTSTIVHNKNGIHLDNSNNTSITKNRILFNLWNGIYLYSSLQNTISNNILFSNGARGIRFHNSDNNTLSKNIISKNNQGLNLYYSISNTIFGNTISKNIDGIWLMFSNQTIIQANTISNNSQYGLRLINSSYNTIFHNNFINNTFKNVEQPTNTSIANLWDNFYEGNYWNDQKSKDINKDGINDIPYITDERTWLGIHSQDNHPLTASFQFLDLQHQNQSYTIEITSNATITNMQYKTNQEKEGNMLILTSLNPDTTSFCRLSIPHSLVEPPYTITVNDNPPTYNNTIYTNGTHTWIYFEYVNTKHEATIKLMHKPTQIQQPPIWIQWPFWGTLGLAITAVILSIFNIKFHKTIKKQENLLRLYEEKLQKANPLLIAKELFTADVTSRHTKIKKFEEKYGVKIQPRSSFEDIIKNIKTKQKENKDPKK
jgi:nitrous oxidase accessory protein